MWVCKCGAANIDYLTNCGLCGQNNPNIVNNYNNTNSDYSDYNDNNDNNDNNGNNEDPYALFRPSENHSDSTSSEYENFFNDSNIPTSFWILMYIFPFMEFLFATGYVANGSIETATKIAHFSIMKWIIYLIIFIIVLIYITH